MGVLPFRAAPHSGHLLQGACLFRVVLKVAATCWALLIVVTIVGDMCGTGGWGRHTRQGWATAPGLAYMLARPAYAPYVLVVSVRGLLPSIQHHSTQRMCTVGMAFILQQQCSTEVVLSVQPTTSGKRGIRSWYGCTDACFPSLAVSAPCV